MATGVGFSFDTSFLKNLEKADAKMASLMDKSNQASRSIVSAFQQMNNQGVVPFVQSLEKQKQTLDSVFDAITTKTGKARKDYEGMASSVVDATNALVSLISKMKSTSQYQLDTKLTGLSSQIKELQEYQERQRQVKVASEQAMNAELDKYRQLIERVRELNSIKTQAKEVKTTSTDKELVKDANKAQREANAELRILKEQQKQIEQKYAVETALIRKQADAQSFQDKVRQAKEAEKAVEAEIKKEQDAYLKSLSEKIIAQQEYAQRMKDLEQARLRQQSANRRAEYNLAMAGEGNLRTKNGIASSADNAISYTNRLYSEKGLRSINNMNLAIQKMQQAQQRLNLNTEQGRQKYEQLDKEIKRVKGDIDRVTGASENLKKSHKGLLDTSGQLARAMAAVFSVSAIKGYINKMIEVRGEFEMQQRSLQVLLQNKEKADELWNKTVALAVKSPLTTQQLVTSTKQLAAYRIEHEKLYETNKMLADVSQGLGVDMNRLILAFGQVKAANFLRGTELRQFSEAGVNLLDELAKRFSAIEGRVVSVGEVFERVSKRMVSFADVEAVFKTITSEGGVFYRMQEKQSETLKGMVLNLKDSYSLMMNDIGKQNDSTIKNFIKLIRDLVNNWRKVAPVVKTLSAAILAAFSAKAIISFKTYLSDVIVALRQIRTGAQGVTAANQAVAASQRVVTKTNPYVFIATCIIAVIAALKEVITYTSKFSDAMYEVEREATTELMQNIYLYKKLASTINDATLTTEERNDALEDMQKKLGDILPLEYLDIEYINSMSDGYQNATSAMKAYYEEKALEQKKDKIRSLTDEDIATDTADLLKSLNRRMWWLRQSTSGAQWGGFTHDMQKMIEPLLPSLIGEMLQEVDSGNLTPLVSEFREFLSKRLSEVTGISKELSRAVFEGEVTERNLRQIRDSLEEREKQMQVVEGLRLSTEAEKEAAIYLERIKSYIDDTRQAYSKIEKEYERFAKGEISDDTLTENIQNIFGDTSDIPEAFVEWLKQTEVELDKISKDGLFNFRNKLFNIKSNFLKGLVDDVKLQQSDLPQTFLGKNLTSVLAKDIESQAEELLKSPIQTSIYATVNDIIDEFEVDDLGQKLLDGILPTEKEATSDVKTKVKGLLDEAKNNIKSYENALSEGEDIQRAEERFFGKGITKEDVLKKTEWLQVLYGRLGGDNKDNAGLAALKKKISLIREMADAYEEMWEKYGKAYADANIYSAARTAAFFEAGLNIRDFSVGGRIDEKNNLAKLIADTSAEILAKESAIAEVEVEIKAKNAEQTKDEMSRLFESMFGDYEVSIEMDELHLPKDFAERMYGFKTTSLNDIRKETLKQYKLDHLSKLSNKDIMQDSAYLALDDASKDQIAKNFEFIEKETQKRQKKLADEYVKYARKTQEERIKIKLEEARKLKDIDELVGATNVEKELYKSNVRRESAQKMAKAEWDEFTKTPYIVQMFDNLDNIGTQALDGLSEKLKTLKDDLYSAGLPASELKEILDKINKVEDELNKRNPFRGLGEGFKNIFGGLAQARKEYNDQIKKQESADLSYSIWVDAYNDFIKTYGEFGGDPDAKKTLEVQMLESKKYAEQMQKETDKVSQKYDDATKSVSLFKQRISDAVEQTKQLAQSAIDVADSYGAFSEKGSKEVVNSAMGIVSGATGVLQAGVKFATFDWVGGVTSLITGITQLIIGINQTGDAMRQMKIEEELKSVKRLQKAYEDLKEAIDNVYDLSVLQQKAAIANQNIEEQIAAQERIIALEEEKKKTDQDAIDGYKEEIESLKKQQKELNEQVFEEKGGFGSDENRKSAAEAFVDAWLQAYKETGDGLSGLNDQFDEFYEGFVKKQLLLQGTSRYLDSFFNQFDNQIASITESGATKEQIANVANAIKETWDGTSSNLDAFLSSLAEALKISEMLGTTELAGLQAGISGITEDQADILAAYWSSVRLYTADTNAKVTELATKLLSDEATTNPMLSQLKIIATNTSQTATNTADIKSILESLSTPAQRIGGRGIKIVMD